MGPSQEFLNLFPAKKRLRALHNIPAVFLDSTPNSLFSPTVAPRVKQMVPHAKFVIVLRVRPLHVCYDFISQHSGSSLLLLTVFYCVVF